MDDAQLVAGALAGDRNAYAAIYDRYADRIHDFCSSILRSRADAAAALQETFLVAFEVLDQLAEPARLRPWLFALAHRTVLEEAADHGDSLAGDAADLLWGSTGPTGSLGAGAGAGSTGSPEGRLSRAEMAEFVWQASAGLSARDRVLLDLHLRQGLDGRDLASAAGVPAPQLDNRRERLETQIERSLGALVVARTGRRSCPNLSALLGQWDGRMTPEFRDQVRAHVDDCEICNSRRRIAPSPLALLGAAPLVPAPAYLRSVVLGKAEFDDVERADGSGGRLLARAGWAFNRDGFPVLSGGAATGGAGAAAGGGDGGDFTRPARSIGSTALIPADRAEWSTGPVFASTRPPAAARPAAGTTPAGAPPVEPPQWRGYDGPSSGDRDRRGMVVGALAGLIILLAAVVIVVSNRTSGNSRTVGLAVTTSTATATTQTSDTTVTTATPVVTPTTVVTTTIASNGHLIVHGASKALNLGTAASSASVMIGNDGQAPLDFVVTASGVGLTVGPISGTLAPDGGQTLTVAFDRTASSPGPFTGAIKISSPGGSATVNVTAVVDPGPTIVGEVSSQPTVFTGNCPSNPIATSAVISAQVTGSQPLNVVVLHWQSSIPAGTGTMTMTASGSTYSGQLGPYRATGSVDWWIAAIDMAGVSTMTAHQMLVVSC